jgi:hypothetical protein
MNPPEVTPKAHGIRGAALSGCVCFALGFGLAWYVAPGRTTAPVPPPVSSSAAAPADGIPYGGHLTVTLIEPLYASPAAAAVRDSLAAVDWHGMDTTFRAYTHGQDELEALGFVSRYTTADLPIAFIQQTRPTGGAPIIDEIKSPASADVVVNRVKELRGAAP